MPRIAILGALTFAFAGLAWPLPAPTQQSAGAVLADPWQQVVMAGPRDDILNRLRPLQAEVAEPPPGAPDPIVVWLREVPGIKLLLDITPMPPPQEKGNAVPSLMTVVAQKS